MGGNENSTFSHFQSEEENQPVSSATSASPGTSADSDTLDCHIAHQLRNVVSLTLRISAGQNYPEDDHQQGCNELAECQPE